MTGIQIVTYLQFRAVPALPPASPSLKDVECVLQSDGKKYRCTGTAWVESQGASSVGSLASSSSISGNPPEFDTPAEIAAALQALQTWKQLADPDNDGDLVEEINMPLIVATVGQTQFTLPRAPQNPMSAVLTAGETPFHPSPQTFTITGTTLFWHFPAQLVPTDKLFISYR